MALTKESALRKDINSGLGEMQHRHFATIAAIIADLPEGRRADMAHHFANRLHRTNPRFDAGRFLAACGAK